MKGVTSITTVQASGTFRSMPPIITKTSIEAASPAMTASRMSMSNPPMIAVTVPPRKAWDRIVRSPPPNIANSSSRSPALEAGARRSRLASSPAIVPSCTRWPMESSPPPGGWARESIARHTR